MDESFLIQKPKAYTCPKVLLGDWFEERSRYKKEPAKFETVYSSSYKPHDFVHRDDSVIWDGLFMAEGHGREILFDHDGLNYADNFSTTYDLTYRHLPKFFCLNSKADHEGEIDLTLNYGPITNRGLRQIYGRRWKYETPSTAKTPTSTYLESYRIPGKKDYFPKFNHKCDRVPGDKGCNPITWECVDERKRSENKK